MPSLKLSKILNRDHHRPTLRERAVALRETVACIKKRKEPALPACDEAASALVEDIEREWAFYSEMSDRMRDDVGPGSDERWEPYALRRDALLDAAAAISPVTREGRHAKALALAWVEFVSCWQKGKAREEYDIAEGYTIDIEAGIRLFDRTEA